MKRKEAWDYLPIGKGDLWVIRILINKIHRFWMRRRLKRYATLPGDIPPGSTIMIVSGKNAGMVRMVVKSEDGIITVDLPFPNELEAGCLMGMIEDAEAEGSAERR